MKNNFVKQGYDSSLMNEHLKNIFLTESTLLWEKTHCTTKIRQNNFRDYI